MHHGDTRATIHSIIKLAKSEPGDPFHAIWKALPSERNQAATAQLTGR
jgi:hypothetical protein